MRRPRVAGLRNRQTDQPDAPLEPETGSAEASAEPSASSRAETRTGTETEETREVDLGTDTAPVPLAADTATSRDSGGDTDSAETGEAELDADEPVGEAEGAARPSRHRAQRPAGKRRTAGVTRPADLTAAEAGTKSTPAAHQADRPRRVANPYSVAAILAVVAVIVAGLAFWFRGEASALESQDTNTALTDSATTSEVLGQLTTAVETTLSYNYTDLESTKKAVDASLAESARCEYDSLFKQLVELAPKQKLILATTVRDIALVRLDGDRAEALVFIDLVSTRVDNNKSVPGDAVFGVRARRDGDSWKVTEFDMFDQELVTGEPVPKC